MALDDNEDKKRLPYRHGGWAGRNNERDMLFRADGSSSFKTSLRDLPDGSQVMLRTKDGMPQFTITKKSETDTPTVTESAYLESGQLEFPYPAPLSPYADSAATWNMLDLSPADTFMASVGTTDTTMGNQVPGQTLLNKQKSKSVCDQTDTKQGVLNKKMCMQYFPASMWSGRMRLFMQAQYGQPLREDAKLPKSYKFRLQLFDGGLPQVVYVFDSNSETQEVISLGWTAGGSVGIFRDSDCVYWLVKIIQGASSYTFRAHRLSFSTVGNSILRYIKKTNPSGLLQKKLEAYLFACASISQGYEVIGTFNVTDAAIGEPMGYGWKFKYSGDEASIVILKVRHENTPDAVFQSCKVVVKISRPNQQWGPLVATEHPAQDWTDGWGNFNLFIPEGLPSIGNTRHLSLQVSGVCRPPFHFSGVEIYGFYDQDDTWIPTTISGEPIDTTVHTVAEYGGGYRWSASIPFPATSFSFNDNLYRAANEGGWWEARTTASTHRMSIAVGDTESIGEISYGASHRYETEVTSIGGACSETKISFMFAFINNTAEAPLPEGYDSISSGQYSLGSYPWITGHGKGSVVKTTHLHGTSFAKGKVWSFVIPCNDCSAAHIAESYTHEHFDGAKDVTISTNGMMKQTAHDIRNDPPGADIDIVPWMAPAHATGSDGHPYWGGATYTSDYMGPELPAQPPTDIDPVITTVSYDSGSGLKKRVESSNSFTLTNPCGSFACNIPPSYGSLFTISRGTFYYTPTIRTTSSANGRYFSTEGPKNPDGTTNTTFVGWA